MKPMTVTAPAGVLTGLCDEEQTLRVFSIPFAYAEPYQPSVPLRPTADRPRTHDGTSRRMDRYAELVLSVTAPMADPDTPKPILLWIHGGRYEIGHPSEPWCDGGHFARNGVVMVSLGYRKRLAGFWRDTPLDDADTDGELATDLSATEPYRGVGDLVNALQWVRDNAAAFGGDPSNITISGQSAGAALALMVAGDPRTRGQIQRAIAMSPAFSRSSGSAFRRSLLSTALGRKATSSALAAVGPVQAERAYRLMAAPAPTDPAVGPRLSEFTPTVPTLVTATSEEFHATWQLTAIDRIPGSEYFARAFSRRIGNRGAFPTDFYKERPFASMVGDSAIRSNAVRVADATANAGLPTWVGEFRPGNGVGTGPDGKPTTGAPHCIELPRFFGREAGHPFHDQVVSFIRTGSPGWETYDEPARLSHIWSGGGAECEESSESDPWKAVRELFVKS
ncbi:carboxylesterase family protein [Corynebacterium sp. H78]|uniref:carboxylesterase family protein n=1 Tax=Corynebacterium sp. H78 TaxID=3133417 RepID=UPI0030B0291F